MKKYVKVLALGLMLAAQAKADFVSLPIQCVAVGGINGSNTNQVSVEIRQPGDSPIVAVVRDHNDVSRMYCQHLNAGGGMIECSGVWMNDKSSARLNATTNTYVPFIRILRSQALFHGATDLGICIPKR